MKQMRSLLLIFAGLLTACTSTQPASPVSTSPSARPVVKWPRQPGPVPPVIELQKGAAPLDSGAVKGWHATRFEVSDRLSAIILSSNGSPQGGAVTITQKFKFGEKEMEAKVSGHLKWFLHFRARDADRRGTILLLGSLYSGGHGIQLDFELINEMTNDGWDVLWTSVHPHQVKNENHKAGAELSRLAGQMARQVDEIIAWEASAADAALYLIRRRHADATRRQPTIYFGISAGAMIVPAVAARTGAPDATVLVCGTSSVGEVVFSTGLSGVRSNVKMASGKEPTREECRELAKLTREAAHLEPEKLAGFLAPARMLLITAGQDRIVLTRLQRELHLALSKPERWHRHGGHTLTILRLQSLWPRLNKWLQGAVGDHRSSP